MGGKSSKGLGRRGVASYGSGGSSTWNPYGYTQLSYPQQNPYYMRRHPCAPPPSTSFNYGSEVQQPQRALDRRYLNIADNYRSLDEVLGHSTDGAYRLNSLRLITTAAKPVLVHAASYTELESHTLLKLVSLTKPSRCLTK